METEYNQYPSEIWIDAFALVQSEGQNAAATALTKYLIAATAGNDAHRRHWWAVGGAVRVLHSNAEPEQLSA